MAFKKHLMLAGMVLLVAAVAQAATLTIEQSGQVFSEKSVSIAAGDSLIFANHDDVTHNIIVTDAADASRDLGMQKPGEDLSVLFDKNGRFRVRCNIHPSMRMTVTVK